mgnify:CR=1 FL=1
MVYSFLRLKTSMFMHLQRWSMLDGLRNDTAYTCFLLYFLSSRSALLFVADLWKVTFSRAVWRCSSMRIYFSLLFLQLHDVFLYQKVRGGAMQDILSERHLKISTFRRRNPASSLLGSFRLLRHFKINGFRHFSRMLIAFLIHQVHLWHHVIHV